MIELTITRPLLPHMAKRAKSRIYRDGTAWAALEKIKRPKWAKARAKLVFYFPDHIRRDIREAEAAMKPAYDGLIDAEVIIDDNSDVFTHDETEFKIDRKNPRVEITVREVNS